MKLEVSIVSDYKCICGQGEKQSGGCVRRKYVLF